MRSTDIGKRIRREPCGRNAHTVAAVGPVTELSRHHLEPLADSSWSTIRLGVVGSKEASALVLGDSEPLGLSFRHRVKRQTSAGRVRECRGAARALDGDLAAIELLAVVDQDDRAP